MNGNPPAVGWYIAAGMLALAGIALAVLIVWREVAGLADPVKILVPGSGVVQVDKPGPHVIWHEHRTVFEGRSYDVPERLPDGVQFRVSAPDGSPVPVRPSSSGTMSSGSVERTAAAEFEAPVAGRYSIAVQGPSAPRIVSVGPDYFWPLFKSIGAAFAAAVAGIGAGIALGLYAFLKQVPGSPTPTVPAGAAADASLRQLVALVYGLQAASLVVCITLLAGVIVNYLKRRDAEGTWLESHFRWQIRTFWWVLLWGVVGLATAVVLVGILVLIASAVWFIYRIAKGWTELNDGRPVGA